MHKKSMEAARKLEESGDDDVCCDEGADCGEENAKDREERRSESIAALRAKAQTYSAQIHGVMTRDEIEGVMTRVEIDDAITRDDAAAMEARQQQRHLGIRCNNDSNSSGFEAPKNDGGDVSSDDVTTCDSYTLDPEN